MKRSGFKPKYPRKEPKQLDACYTIKPKAVACRIEGPADRMSVPVPKDNPVRSEAYRRLVAQMPCCECGAEGRSQAAHANYGKGMGAKTDDRTCFALCGPGSTFMGIAGYLWGPGCHFMLDQGGLYSKQVRREKEALWGKQTRAAIRAAGAWPKNLPEWEPDEEDHS